MNAKFCNSQVLGTAHEATEQVNTILEETERRRAEAARGPIDLQQMVLCSSLQCLHKRDFHAGSVPAPLLNTGSCSQRVSQGQNRHACAHSPRGIALAPVTHGTAFSDTWGLKPMPGETHSAFPRHPRVPDHRRAIREAACPSVGSVCQG